MRISAILFAPLLFLATTGLMPAQDPGAQQDAEAAREKLLNAADQLDNIQANSESTKQAVDAMKADVTKLQADVQALQTENDSLKQQIDDLHTQLAQSEAARLKDRQTLIDNVADMLAAQKSSTHSKKKADSDTDNTTQAEKSTSTAPSANPNLAPPPDPSSSSSTSAGTDSGTDTAPPAHQKGYYHVVEEGETLTLICNAYRDNGVKVTVAEIRKANGLTEKSVLKPGQRLFIPKPGT